MGFRYVGNLELGSQGISDVLQKVDIVYIVWMKVQCCSDKVMGYVCTGMSLRCKLPA